MTDLPIDLAEFEGGDLSVDSSPDIPVAGGPVGAMVVSGGKLYVGGRFGRVGLRRVRRCA